MYTNSADKINWWICLLRVYSMWESGITVNGIHIYYIVYFPFQVQRLKAWTRTKGLLPTKEKWTFFCITDCTSQWPRAQCVGVKTDAWDLNPSSVIPVTYPLIFLCLPYQTPGVLGSVLGLADPEVNTLGLGDTASLIFNFYLAIAASNLYTKVYSCVCPTRLQVFWGQC